MPPDAVNITLFPKQKVWSGPAFAVGAEFTNTFTESELVQVPTDPVTKYVIVSGGVAIGSVHVVQLRFVSGVQVYETSCKFDVADKNAESPSQIPIAVPASDTRGTV